MKQVITAKLKLDVTPEQRKLLGDTCLAYRDALNYASKVAFAFEKTSSANKLHKLTYNELRVIYGLPSQMACRVPRNVASTYKGLWTKVKQNAEHRKKGNTKKRYKGLDKAPKFASRSYELVYERDFGFKKDKHVSVMTLLGRLVIPYQGWNKHIALIQSGGKVGGARVWYSKSSKTYYLLVSLEIEVSEPEEKQIKTVEGVDVGQRYLAVTTNTSSSTKFYSGKQSIHTANRYFKARKSLQRKGTRSAKRRLLQLSGRERRFKADVNHCISKQIAKPNTLIGMECLTGIRNRTNRRQRKKASKKQKRANRRQANWAFRELQGFVTYKTHLVGGLPVFVDADYSSQSCPKCGQTHKSNRPQKGLRFKCISCGYELHADLVGARNVCMRTLLVRQDWTSTGVLSMRPDVARDEAKAERLSRYSELRWTVATSPTSIRQDEAG